MKLCVIGIDGGELNLIRQYIKDLPNLKYIMDNGVYGEMESTLPPITCPAWPCMFTGLNPAELGMFYFVDMADTFKVFTYADWQAHALWNKFKGTVGLFNIPMTYPPGEVNGYVVSGLGTPAGARGITYPASLRVGLGDNYWVQAPAVLTSRGHEEEYYKVFMGDIRRKIKTATCLLGDYPYDLNIFVFNTTDQASHYFWHHIDSKHPCYVSDSPYRNILYWLYRDIDFFIGYALQKCDKVIIVSDHGFQPFKRCLNINKWLEQEGYLKYKVAPNQNIGVKTKRSVRNYLVAKLGAKNANIVARFMPGWLKRGLSTIEEERRSEENLTGTLDMGRTVAYSYGISAGIYVNGNDGITEEIKVKLEGYIKSMGLGGSVRRKAEVYRGKYIDKAPDLVIEASEWYPSTLGYGELWPEPFTPGMHRKYGLYMGLGVEGQARHINEVAPIILKTLEG